MKTIRRGTFETNSSSCHAITVVEIDLLEQYREGQVICLASFHLAEDSIITNYPDEDNFYDFDTFFSLIQRKANKWNYGDVYYDDIDEEEALYAEWLFRADESEIKSVFFDGEYGDRDKEILSNLGKYLINGCRIYSNALKLDDDPLILHNDGEETRVYDTIRIENNMMV